MSLWAYDLKRNDRFPLENFKEIKSLRTGKIFIGKLIVAPVCVVCPFC